MTKQTESRVRHGVNAYKRGKCRCDVCTKANTDYERMRRNRNRRKLPSMDGLEDCYTREALLRWREEHGC